MLSLSYIFRLGLGLCKYIETCDFSSVPSISYMVIHPHMISHPDPVHDVGRLYGFRCSVVTSISHAILYFVSKNSYKEHGEKESMK